MADYNINAVKRRTVLSGSAGVGPYAFTFEVLDQTDINVYKNTTLLTLTTDYTVTVSANGTGSVTLVTAATSSDDITIIGARDIERTTDFVTAGDLKASSLNEQLDAQVIFTQQVDERVDRALKGNFSDPTDLDYTIPSVDDRKGKYLAFNATSGAPEAGPSTANVNSLAAITDDIATLADIEDGTDATDAIQTVAGISANVSTVAGVSSNVTTVAGISSDVTSVAGDASDIGTVATDITNVNTVATNIANINTNVTNITAIQNASTNATTATTKAAEAASSATDAQASEDEAEAWAQKIDGEAVTGEGYSSKAWATGGTGVTDTAGSGAAKEWAIETASSVDGTEYSAKEYAIGSQSGQTSGSAKQWALGGGASYATNTTVDGTNYSAKYWAEQAAASVDSFDDTYLGSKSSDPTVDNDGDALTSGDLYFSTTANKLRVYDGTNWNDAVTDTTGFATNGFAIAMAIAL